MGCVVRYRAMIDVKVTRHQALAYKPPPLALMLLDVTELPDKVQFSKLKESESNTKMPAPRVPTTLFDMVLLATRRESVVNTYSPPALLGAKLAVTVLSTL